MIDLEAIKRKIEQLEGKGQSKYKKVTWFKPKAGNEYQIRVMPFKGDDGQPFKEMWFYNNIGKFISIPTLKQYKEPDPFSELIDELRKRNTEVSLKTAKLLYAKMRVFSAIIVRGEEEKGPQVYGFGKTIYQKMLEKMLDTDFGDVADLENGFDLKLKVKQAPGKAAPDYDLSAYPSDKKAVPSPLAKSKEQADAWMAQMPDLNNLFKKRDYAEMKQILEEYISGLSEPTAPAVNNASVGIARSPAASTVKSDDDDSDSNYDNVDKALDGLVDA